MGGIRDEVRGPTKAATWLKVLQDHRWRILALGGCPAKWTWVLRKRRR